MPGCSPDLFARPVAVEQTAEPEFLKIPIPPAFVVAFISARPRGGVFFVAFSHRLSPAAVYRDTTL